MKAGWFKATLTHDNSGNLSSRTDSRGVLTSYSYDALNRITGATYTKAGQSSQALQWIYDQTGPGFSNGIGRLTTASFPEGSTVYSYDTQGRITSAVQTVNATTGANVVALTHAVGYGYTAAGHLASVTYPSGRQVQIGYTDGLPSSVSLLSSPGGSSQSLMTNLQYSPFGQLQSWNWVMPSGNLPHGRTFDSSGRMQRYAIGPYMRENVYDEAGRISWIKSFLVSSGGTSGALVPAQTRNYVYDRADRLVSVLDTNGAMVQMYAYDANGNRTNSKSRNQIGTTTFTIQPTSNRITTATYPYLGFTYDAAGNTTSDGVYVLGYDLRGRLNELSNQGGNSQTSRVRAASFQGYTYSYDNAGQRVRKYSSVGAGSTMIFVYDQSNHLIGEYDANGNVLREYVWLGDQPVAMIDPDPANAGVSRVFYVHTDHLNTPRALVDSTNRLRWIWKGLDEPFGGDFPLSDPIQMGSVTFNLRSPGQIYDSESGLHYNFHRDYVPNMGRYAQSDPIGLEGGINTYLYAEANPVSYADPLGLRSNRPAWWNEGWAPKTPPGNCATAECAAGFGPTSSPGTTLPTDGLTCTARVGVGVGVTASYNTSRGLTYLGFGPQVGLSFTVTGGGLVHTTGAGAQGPVVQASGAFGNGIIGISGNSAVGANGSTTTVSPGVGTIGISIGVTGGYRQ